jgi:hypothetical protein
MWLGYAPKERAIITLTETEEAGLEKVVVVCTEIVSVELGETVLVLS